MLLIGIAERAHAMAVTRRSGSPPRMAARGWAQRVLIDVARFLRGLIDVAEQLTAAHVFYCVPIWRTHKC